MNDEVNAAGDYQHLPENHSADRDVLKSESLGLGNVSTPENEIPTSITNSTTDGPENLMTFEYDVSDCFHAVIMDVPGHVGILTIRGLSSWAHANDMQCIWRLSAPNSSFVNITFIRFNIPCKSGFLFVYNEHNCYEPEICMENKMKGLLRKPRPIVSTTNVLLLRFVLLTTSPEDHFTLFFTSSRDRSHVDFGLYFRSPHSGYLTVPGYDLETKRSVCANVFYQLPVPRNRNIVMLSMWQWPAQGFFAEETGRLEIYQGPGGPLLARTSIFDSRRFYVLTAPLQFHFEDSSIIGYVCRTKIVFSFHAQAEPPPSLAAVEGGLVNCSTPRLFALLEPHVRCDLARQCLGGEDERGCPHTSPDCDGHLLFNNTCLTYMLSGPRKEPTDDGSSAVTSDTKDPCLGAGKRMLIVRDIWQMNAVLTIMGLSPFSRRPAVHVTVSSPRLPVYYQQSTQNLDGSINYFFPVDISNANGRCAVLMDSESIEVSFVKCSSVDCHCFYICEFSPSSAVTEMSPTLVDRRPHVLEIPEFSLTFLSVIPGQSDNEHSTGVPPVFSMASYKAGNASGSHQFTRGHPVLRLCEQGHVTFDFLPCDDSVSDYDAGMLPAFICASGRSLPYTLVCDFHPDCRDSSDEDFCNHEPCGTLSPCATSKQCVALGAWCDGRQHCRDRSDEEGCKLRKSDEDRSSLGSPAVVRFDGYGRFNITPLPGQGDAGTVRAKGDGVTCPGTHFLCPGSYCLPVFVVCNGVHDCPGREDEGQCGHHRPCPGLYRCRRSAVCLHPDHLCDGVFQCPLHDDELMCDVSCPRECRCQGLSAVCSRPLPVDSRVRLRYVDGSGSLAKPRSFQANRLLVFLRLAKCRLHSLGSFHLPNLQTLDVRDNLIESVHMDTLVRQGNLKKLLLSRNPIASVQLDGSGQSPQSSLLLADLSRTQLRVFVSRHFRLFEKLAVLNLSGSPVSGIDEDGLRYIPSLEVLDVRGTKLENFGGDVFLGLTDLSKIFADNYKLCCRANLPDYFSRENCLAPEDELSSCEDLLRSDAYRACLWVLAVMATAGNIGSVVFKMWFETDSKVTGFSVFVMQLNVSDLCMGLYLVIIGSADVRYRSQYLWYDAAWKHSILCRAAGFLSFLSAEVSAFVIFLITLDRFIVFRFPFSSVRFHSRSAIVACITVWLLGAILAVVPLLPVTSHWDYYSQTGICIPLPITRKDFAGRGYSFAVMILLNLAVFLMIAAGQVSIYLSIHSTSMAAGDLAQTSAGRKSRDAAIVRRLSAVVVSDFLCWFPIGLLGVLSSLGVPIPGWLNVAVAVLILPINSAVNPFLYTYNLLMERRRKLRRAAKQKFIDRILRDFHENRAPCSPEVQRQGQNPG